MDLKINSKKVIASVMALSIVASGVISTEASVFSKIIPTNTISASAAVSYGDWEYEEINSYTAKLTKYKGNGGYVIIPESINGHSVKELGFGLFNSNKNVKSVSIPRGVIAIPDQCFDGATSLETVNIPEGLKTIGSSAFCGATNLKTISIPQSVTTIDYNAFCSSGITSISLPSVNTFGTHVFYNCKNLKSVILSNSVSKLTYAMFSKCSSLESIVIPNTVSSIDAFAFEQCTNLKSVTISRYPENLFREGVFRDCTSLENLNISDPAILNKLFVTQSLNSCKNFNKINNQPIVSYRTKRGATGREPIFQSAFDEVIRKNFAYCDVQKFAFYNEYLSAIVKYVVQTNTYSSQTTGEKIKTLHDWVCNKVDYAFVNGNPDPSKECHVDSSVFMRNTTVCDGYARALTLLLREAGIEAYYLSSSTHAWCMVKLGKHFYHVDATENDNFGISMTLQSDKSIKLNETENDSHFKWQIAIPRNSRISYDIPTTTPTCPYTIGDIDGDGFRSSLDAVLIQKYLLKIYNVVNGMIYIDNSTFGIDDITVLDTNYDGVINMPDATTLTSQK